MSQHQFSFSLALVCLFVFYGILAPACWFLTVWSSLWQAGPCRSGLVIYLQWSQRWQAHPSRNGHVPCVAPQVLTYALRRNQAPPIRSPHFCQQRNRGLSIRALKASWPSDSYAIICGVGRQQARFSSTQKMPYGTVLRRIRTLLL